MEPLLCGGQGENENGNGSLMRIAPLVFYIQKKFGDSAFDNKDTFEVIHNVSRLTHAHPIALVGCDIYIAVLFALLHGMEKDAALKFAIEKVSRYVQTYPELKKAIAKYQRLTKEAFIQLPERKISSSGYVVDTLEAVLWCFLTTDCYRDCILKAVNLGKDTDSIAAVSGALAGLYYADAIEKGIPEEWKCVLQNKALIENVIKKLSIKYDSDYASQHVMLYL